LPPTSAQLKDSKEPIEIIGWSIYPKTNIDVMN